MAKGRNIDFLVHMKTEENFETHVLNDDENLWLLDVYTEWCGHCTCIFNTFMKMKIDNSDQPLKFGTVSADNVSFLSRYKGFSQPTFMWMSGNGTLIDVVRGVNVPLITKKTMQHLEFEKKVQNGEATRVPFFDEAVATPKPDQSPEAEGEQEDTRPVTLALIKPDAVSAGKVDDILSKLSDAGIEVVSKVEKELTREEAEMFYREHEGTDFFLQLIDYMTSGPIVALALRADDPTMNVVEQWRLLIGPKDVTIAKEEAPESLRAQFASGEEPFKNALHGSDSAEQAARELAFFFPDFGTKKKKTKQRLQRTLALIRPDALRKYKDEILENIKNSGFEIAKAKEVTLTKEQAAIFYKEHAEQDYFDKLCTHMSSGPVMALALCREDAISGWRDVLGPKNVDEAKDVAPDSLRAQFVEDEDDPALNALHGSDSVESAEREYNFFFPKQHTVAVIKPDTTDEEKDKILTKIKAEGFLIEHQKETVLTKDLVEQFYGEHSGKEFFGELTEFMTSGPTMLMLLSREDAVSGMREIVGPADPEKAREVAPDSIRAELGKDKLKNSIHAPVDEEKAIEEMKLVFADEVEFGEDGRVLSIQGESAVSKDESVAEGEEQPKAEDAVEQAGEVEGEQVEG